MKLVFIENNRPITDSIMIAETFSGIENKTQTLVTPKGKAYIHKLLLENGKVTA